MRVVPKPGRVPPTNRGSADVGAQQTSQPITFPAPSQGLVTAVDIANQVQGAASVLRNWFPTISGARIRGGSRKHGLASTGADFVSAFKYKYGTNEKMFMATAAGIFDMSSPAVPPATTAPVVSGQASGDWCTFQHTNSGVSTLVCVNGANDRQLFNGSTWGTSPAITFPDATTMSQLGFGFLFKSRQWFLKAGTLDAYYLGTNAIGGASTLFPLGGVMKEGGSLLMGFSWSLESGDGLAARCVFVTTEGEVAVYDGDDPASASTWSLVGVYQMGKPLGKNAWIRAGGDTLIATTDGLTPLSQVFQRDRQALSLVSISRPIEDQWKIAANAVGSGWTLKQWEEQNLVFVSFPETLVLSDTTFVVNVLTGKWGTVSNWYANCYEMYQGSLFFGSVDGVCWQGDITGTDDGSAFSATFLSQFVPGASYGQRAEATMATMYFKGKSKPNVRLYARADMDMTAPSYSTVTVGSSASSDWDVGLWDVALWDNVSTQQRFKFRQNVRASGDLLALGAIVTSGGDYKLDVEIDLGVMQVTLGEASA